VPKQTYKNKATSGQRRREGYRFTLAPETDRLLDTLSKQTGLSRSRIIDQLVQERALKKP
jgi:hypothetical protein